MLWRTRSVYMPALKNTPEFAVALPQRGPGTVDQVHGQNVGCGAGRPSPVAPRTLKRQTSGPASKPCRRHRWSGGRRLCPYGPRRLAQLSSCAHEITPDALIIAYDVQGNDVARSFLDIVNGHRHQPLDPQGNTFIGAGVDPGGSIADHWCPGAANLAIFGDRRHARRTIRADVLAASGFLGQAVNVVIIDEGLDKARIPPHNWGGGLDHYIDTDLVLPAGSAPLTSTRHDASRAAF